MLLHDKIENDYRALIQAKTKDPAISVLKYFIGEFDRRPNPGKRLDDSEVINKLSKFVEFSKENLKLPLGDDGKTKILFEISVARRYLPEEASEDEVRNFINEKFPLMKDLSSPERMKKMGIIMKELQGRIKGDVVKNILMKI